MIFLQSTKPEYGRAQIANVPVFDIFILQISQSIHLVQHENYTTLLARFACDDASGNYGASASA